MRQQSYQNSSLTLSSIYISLVAVLINRLSPRTPRNGLQDIVKSWKEPDGSDAYRFPWPEDFSRDIVPEACHSHNDYWRKVPLYEALAAGCVSIEADIWLEGNDLLVGHVKKVLKSSRTLRTLYIDPIVNILSNRNVSNTSEPIKEVGIFETDPNAAVILMLDFKTDGHDLWPVVLSQLEPLRQKGWLTYFNGIDIVPGPITVVGTGNTPFDLVVANSTYRYLFFDAPLLDISNSSYTVQNSYYASTALKPAIGRIWLRGLSRGQVNAMKIQIKAAGAKGLKSRYWDTPAWPISLRDKAWNTLVENGVGMLNIDDLISATRWNWDRCVVAGLTLCGA